MTTANQYLLALQACQEIQAEPHLGEKTCPAPGTPAKNPSVVRTASLPAGSLLLGLAEDGLPLLLDLCDPSPGPLLVAGDGGSGKTAFLQSLARLSDLQDPGDISFGVLTPFPEEWVALEALPHCMGIWPAYHPSAQFFLSQLQSMAEALPPTRQSILLLFDGIDLMTGSAFQYQHELRWLLMYGPERRVWPVLSVNPARMARLQTWLDYFHTQFIGRVKNIHNARLLLNDPHVDLSELLPGVQFGLSQSGSWMKFWLPPLE